VSLLLCRLENRRFQVSWFGFARLATALSLPRPFEGVAASTPLVTPGLDPGIHQSSQDSIAKQMDCRVKPGNDDSGQIFST